MIGFHCTTKKKLERYKATGGILPPVRFWLKESVAREWGRHHHRELLLKIEVNDSVSYPLPDHKPRGMGWWVDEIVHKMEEA